MLPRDGHRSLVDRGPPLVANSRFAAAVEGGEDYVPAEVRQRSATARGRHGGKRCAASPQHQTLPLRDILD